MDTDLIKSILSLVTATIPLIIAIFTLILSRANNPNEPIDSPSLKLLSIKREPVEQKYWKQFKRSQVVVSIVWAVPSMLLYGYAYFYSSGQIKNSVLLIIFIIISNATFIWVSNMISKLSYHNYIFDIKDAYNGRYFLFNSIIVEVEADYYYLFNKCHEALKSKYLIVEIDAGIGVIEARFDNYHFSSSIKDNGIIKAKIIQKVETSNIFYVSIEVEMAGIISVADKLTSFSKMANRFVNQLISKPKNSAQKG